MIAYDILHRTWRPLVPEHQDRLAAILEKWKGTRYVAGGSIPGVGVDCVRFVCAVLDEWLGRNPTPIETLPPDTAMHCRESAMVVMRELLSRYQPVDEVTDGSIQPGDILVTGAAGPGHAIIVGTQRNTMWQASATHVHFTGIALVRGQQFLFAHYRIREAAAWSSI